MTREEAIFTIEQWFTMRHTKTEIKAEREDQE